MWIALNVHTMNILRKITACVISLMMILSAFWLISREVSRGKIYTLLQKEGKGWGLTTRLEVTETIFQLSRQYKIDPMLILAVMKVESHFDLNARSNRGALGLMQVRPIVIREVAKDLGIDPKSSQQLLINHRMNLRVSIHYISDLLEKFGGDIRKALMAYNRGPTSVARNYKNRPVPANGYQEKVMRIFEDYSRS